MKSCAIVAGMILGLCNAAYAVEILHSETKDDGATVLTVNYISAKDQCRLTKQLGSQRFHFAFDMQDGYILKYQNQAKERASLSGIRAVNVAERYWHGVQLRLLTEQGELGRWRTQGQDEITGVMSWNVSFDQVIISQVILDHDHGILSTVLLDESDWTDDVIDYFSECQVYLAYTL